MRGVIRAFFLPLVAVSLFLLGCGVEIAPEAITATAVAEEQAEGRSLASTFSGSAANDSARSLAPGSSSLEGGTSQAVEPIATLASPGETPTPDPEDAAFGIDASPTSDPGATDDDLREGNEDAEAAEAATSTPAPAETPPPAVADVNGEFATEFLALLNAQRTGRGMGALGMNVILTAGATKFAGYMGTAGFFGHDGPDGSTAASRAQSTGYTGAWNGEALSAGQATPQTALNALLASPPHAAILLDPRSVEVGVGYAYVEGSRYRHYWVIMTGIP